VLLAVHAGAETFVIIESLVAEQRGAHNGRLSTPGPLPMVTAGNKRTTQPIAMPIATLR
jgi:hypothetical protein